MCVAKTVHDINRRDSNVVVVGLPEQLNTNDKDVFSSFCEDYLSVKPSIVWCRRLGSSTSSNQSSNRRPRRLLVKLRSAEVAADLRRASITLRRCSDEVVRSVYINPDLTREQAQLVYELRQKRRAHRQQTSNAPTVSGDESNTNDQSAVRFSPLAADSNVPVANNKDCTSSEVQSFQQQC